VYGLDLLHSIDLVGMVVVGAVFGIQTVFGCSPGSTARSGRCYSHSAERGVVVLLALKGPTLISVSAAATDGS
jgi:hypothetical protein